MPDETRDAFWSVPVAELFSAVESCAGGLTQAQAAKHLARFGPNRLRPEARDNDMRLLLRQFSSPIVLLLLGAAILSGFLGDAGDAIIIMVIVVASGLLGFFQERGAAGAVRSLLARVSVRVRVIRDAGELEIAWVDVTPGDIVVLSAGSAVPADCRLLECLDLFVDESALTGETFPVEKSLGDVGADSALAKRTNSVWMGTHVVSGTARALVVRTGLDTEFGGISEHLHAQPPETEFEHGVRRFGYLLLEVTLVMVIGIFAINVYLHRPVLDSFLFALALAVGLTPQLLPAIISINLSHGAREMAKQQVIVKRLASIENLGSMNVLCSDKTGTLTEGIVHVKGTVDIGGVESQRVLLLAALNSSMETGFKNPIDDAVRAIAGDLTAGWTKFDEVPYDFLRKRLSILARKDDGPYLMITKGAVRAVLDVCTDCRMSDGTACAITERSDEIAARVQSLAEQGLRTLAVATREFNTNVDITREHEEKMVFEGLVILYDPPKADASVAVEDLRVLGVALKIITGDAAAVARTLGGQMGLTEPVVMTGSELGKLSDAALVRSARGIDVFAEIEPNQKERIIVALRHSGNVVGFIGDGINDAVALHAADVGISVNSAVDVAKDAAQIVLLESGLDVLASGVKSGRTTFANTLKYVFMATSANFGNMFSMAGASLFLPFLPLLPSQILLMNLMTDFPEMTIATDHVDAELVERPRRWDVKFIRNFMLTFGPVSSIFDYATFGILMLMLHAGPAEFRTGWFIESILSASGIVLVIRTRRPFFRSRPSWQLAATTAVIAAATIALPYSPLGALFKLVPLPARFFPPLAVILVLYVLTAEVAKRVFYRANP
jgi:Mg2+-importing ATPase